MKKEKKDIDEQTSPIEGHEKVDTMSELKVIKKEDLWRFRGGGRGTTIDL